MLRLNVSLNRLKNVIAIRSAVADFNGTAKLHIPRVKGIKLTDQGTLIHRAGQIIEVPAVMLDTALERMNIQPDVIKIDVEGSELEVVEGSLQTLARGVQLVVIELHRSDARKHIIELLSNLDYAISEKGKFLFLRVRDFGSANRRDKAIGCFSR
jgi:FkbM family methyltransferase